MQKILLLLLSLGMFFSVAAQNAPVDFEAAGNGASWTWTVFENDSNPPLEIIANPDASGINTSATVAKFTALQAGQPFAGCETQHGADIGSFVLTPSTSTITIMVWKSVISDVGIKLVEAGSGSLGEIKMANTLVNQWEELTFNFSAAEGITYDQIVVFPDFNARMMDNIIYFDNITFGGMTPIAEPMVAAPDPTIDPMDVLSMFSNVYTDVPVDTWQTSWSMGVLSDIQIAGNDTKKYEAVDFVGVETVGANLIDATGMDFFHLDIWTPNMTTFRVKLVDFGADESFGGGDDSEDEIVFENPTQNTWVSLQIPFTDFTGLTSRDHLAQLVFSGLPAGGGVVYVDNVYFSAMSINVTDLEIEQIKLFPNPAQNSINITSDQRIETLKIYNVLGELVLAPQANEFSSTVDIASLTNGIYFVTAIVNGVTIAEQFVKQ